MAIDNNNAPTNTGPLSTPSPTSKSVTADIGTTNKGRAVSPIEPQRQMVGGPGLGENSGDRPVKILDGPSLTIATGPKKPEDMASLLERFAEKHKQWMEIDHTMRTIDFLEEALSFHESDSENFFDEYYSFATSLLEQESGLLIKMNIAPHGELELFPPSDKLKDAANDLKQILDVSLILAQSLLQKKGGEDSFQKAINEAQSLSEEIDAHINKLPEEQKSEAKQQYEQIINQGVKLNSHWKDLSELDKSTYFVSSASIEISSLDRQQSEEEKKKKKINTTPHQKPASNVEQKQQVLNQIVERGLELSALNRNKVVEVEVKDDSVSFFRAAVALATQEKNWLAQKNADEVRAFVSENGIDEEIKNCIDAAFDTQMNQDSLKSPSIKSAVLDKRKQVVDGIYDLINSGRLNAPNFDTLQTVFGVSDLKGNKDQIVKDFKNICNFVSKAMMQMVNQKGQVEGEGVYIDSARGSYGLKVNPKFQWNE